MGSPGRRRADGEAYTTEEVLDGPSPDPEPGPSRHRVQGSQREPHCGSSTRRGEPEDPLARRRVIDEAWDLFLANDNFRRWPESSRFELAESLEPVIESIRGLQSRHARA